MNVKISIELPEAQLAFAEQKVREGSYESITDLVVTAVRDLMLSDAEPATLTDTQVNDVVTSMADVIRKRLELPDDKWLSEEQFDQEFDELIEEVDEEIRIRGNM